MKYPKCKHEAGTVSIDDVDIHLAPLYFEWHNTQEVHGQCFKCWCKDVKKIMEVLAG